MHFNSLDGCAVLLAAKDLPLKDLRLDLDFQKMTCVMNDSRYVGYNEFNFRVRVMKSRKGEGNKMLHGGERKTSLTLV